MALTRAITVLAFHFHKTRQVVKCCRRILIIFKLQVGVNCWTGPCVFLHVRESFESEQI